MDLARSDKGCIIVPTGRYDGRGDGQSMPNRRGADTRKRIIEAAEACFAARGYDGTGVAEICERAGVTKGGFYHHFSSKHALFLELLERWLSLLDRQLNALAAGAENVPQALLDMAGIAEPVFREAGARLPLFLEFWRQASRDPTAWKATVAPYRRYRALFARMIEAGIDEVTMRAVDAEVAAGAIVSLAVGLVMQGLMDPDGGDWGLVSRESLRWLVASMVQEPTLG